MSTERLAGLNIEFTVDAEKLNASIKESLANAEKLGKQTEESFKTVANSGVNKATQSVKQFNQQLTQSISHQKKLKEASLALRSLEKLGGFAEKGIGIGGAMFATATGLTFAAAAAAGSTTLDTLTGSLKMLSLAAGAKTQTGVLRVSKALQDLSKTVENAPEGAVGGTIGAGAGALLGAKIGSMIVPGLGTLIGAGIGGIAGGIGGSRLESLGKTEEIARQLKRNPEMIGELLKKERELRADAQNSPIAGGEMIGQANRIRAAIKMVEDKRVPGPEAGPIMAGLGFGSRISALANIREETQLAGLSMGPLELQNLIKELQNNTKAIQEANQGNNKPEVPKQNVQPAGNN